MIKMYLRKRMRILRGFVRSFIKPVKNNYKADTWWDSIFYTKGLSNPKTLGPDKSLLSSFYHYNSVELLILRHFYNKNLNPEGATVLDIGSGAGYWIDFYKKIGAGDCTGIDVSKSSVAFLKEKYQSDPSINIQHGSIVNLLPNSNEKYDIINAIGVMFHVVDDKEWQQSLELLSGALKPDGIFVIGGHFGAIDNLNVHVDKNGQVFKRLHSAGRWKRALRQLGFRKIKLYRNNAYLHINDTLPENNILIAGK